MGNFRKRIVSVTVALDDGSTVVEEFQADDNAFYREYHNQGGRKGNGYTTEYISCEAHWSKDPEPVRTSVSVADLDAQDLEKAKDA